MNLLCTTLIILVAGLVVISVAKIFINIHRNIKGQESFDKRYKVSFDKHFKKVKVPLIKMKIGGNLKYFIVDSGAEANILATDFFESLDPKYITQSDIEAQLISAEGSSTKALVVHIDLSFKKEKYPSIPFLVTKLVDATEWIQESTKICIAGILGSEFFAQYKWLIDFDERCIWVSQLDKEENE